MNTKPQQKPVQIPVRDILVSRYHKLCDRLADLRKVLPSGDFSTVEKYLRGAETVLEHFNPKSEDRSLVDYNLVKADKALVEDFFKGAIAVTEKKEEPKPEVKVTAPVTGQFVGEAKEVNIEAVLAGKNMLPLSSLRDLKAAASTPNRSKRQEGKKKSSEPQKKGSKRPGGAKATVEVTTKKRTTKK